MFKKRYLIIMAVLLTFMLGITGCSSTQSTQSTEPASGDEQTQAVNYPTKPIKLVITHGPGSGTDIIARIMQPFLQKELGQPVVVENMEGAGGRLARATVFKEKNDGYTLLVTNFPSTQLGELLYKGDYKTSEFTPIYSFVGSEAYFVLYVAQDSPFKTLKDMVDASQKKPVTLGVPGLGSGAHLAAALFKEKAGLKADLVPFDAAQVLLNVAGKQIDGGTDTGDGVAAENGKRIRVLTQASDSGRSPLYPDVMTTAENGYPGMELANSTCLLAPPNTDQAIVDVLVAAMEKVAANPEYIANAEKAGYIPCALGPDEVKKMNDDMMANLQEIVPTMLKEMESSGQTN
ncbi:Bug family tripartite tricarboxylate transporter substrate binding protein [Candidatus Formimonas warabiya]|uniref:Tripartite tricarboxylate transporter substrate binding protein n=1 Tax=Formimonas warabiya TaxID=1761012 RepID=A0A3G1KXI7_FORW1|nr:tripartite tricarboxylate transporter substrate binding protein [Candidatus Formimonas warabiya]ATW27152.1 hypothetical protein DCMF_22535 [Candidatus Formimonas warabiya]